MTPGPTGTDMGLPAIDHLQAAFETFGTGHGDGPDTVVPELLLLFEGQLHGLFTDFEFNYQRMVDAWDSLWEFHIDDRTDHLDDFAFVHNWFQILVCRKHLNWRPSGR